MKLATPLLLPILAITAACGGAAAGDAAPESIDSTDKSHVQPDDARIAELVYDTSYSVPEGFFVDERADTARSFTIHHVLDASASYELCTDDYAIAAAWEEADNASRSVQGYFVESYDNDRYFEFVRELSYDDDVGNIDDVTSPGFARVFKCSNTNRDGVDRSLLTGYAGRLNVYPLDEGSIRIFAEYLWQFAFFPASRKKVIDSSGSRVGDDLQRTLLLAFATNQGADRCDLIEVAEWRFRVASESGEVSKTLTTLHSFEARSDNGTIVICD